MYDFMPTSNWSPYVGAGLGGVEYSARSLRAGTATSTDKDTTWAAQGIAGLWYAIDPNWLVSADYRFQYTGDTKLGTNVSGATIEPDNMRSEEHTSELQSLMRISYAVFCLKKKKQRTDTQELK